MANFVKFVVLSTVCNRLSRDRFGFKAGKTTVAFIDDIVSLVKGLKLRPHTAAMFSDLNKVSDYVDHETLFDKLNSHVVCGISLHWLEFFRDDRSQGINIGKKIPDSAKLAYFILQMIDPIDPKLSYFIITGEGRLA